MRFTDKNGKMLLIEKINRLFAYLSIINCRTGRLPAKSDADRGECCAESKRVLLLVHEQAPLQGRGLRGLREGQP